MRDRLLCAGWDDLVATPELRAQFFGPCGELSDSEQSDSGQSDSELFDSDPSDTEQVL